MATGHRVSGPLKKNRIPPPLPREVEPTAARQYVDRWGFTYCVIWNGLKSDPSLLSTCWAQSSGCLRIEPY